jgi:hypothetical protein
MAEIEAVLMEYGYPANPHNAARAGFEAARRMLAAAAQRMLAASAKAAGPEREKAERDMYLFGTGFLVDGEHVDPSRIQVLYKSEPAGDVAPVHPVDALKDLGGPISADMEAKLRAVCDEPVDQYGYSAVVKDPIIEPHPWINREAWLRAMDNGLPPGWTVLEGTDGSLSVGHPRHGHVVVRGPGNDNAESHKGMALWLLVKDLIEPKRVFVEQHLNDPSPTSGPQTLAAAVDYGAASFEAAGYSLGHPCDYPGPVEPGDRMTGADFSDLELRVATAAEARERGLLDLMLFGNRYGTAKPKIESVDFASLELRFNHEGWALLNEAWDFGQFADDFDVPLAKPIRAAIRQVLDETFDQAWAEFEAAGFRYGRDALEQVRFGFEIARGRRPEKKP